MREPSFLGVEGGGSKARAILDCQGRVLVRLESNGLNPSDLTAAEFQARLRSLLNPLLAQLPSTRAPIYGYFALAGAGRPAVRRRVRGAIGRVLVARCACRRLEVTTDAGALVERYLRERGGIVLIAGTGSICVAVRYAGKRRRLVRVGGRGGLHDRGSGWWIGARLIQHALRTADRSGERSACASLHFAEHGASASDVARAFPPWERAKVASLAERVLRAGPSGDSVAQAIVDEATGDLVKMVVAADAKARLHGRTDLYLAGGLFQSEALRVSFERRLRDVLPGVTPRPVTDDLSSLLRLAKQLARPRRSGPGRQPRARPVRSAASHP